jgi:hypothetical protein
MLVAQQRKPAGQDVADDGLDTAGNISAFEGTVSGFGQSHHQFIDLTGVPYVSGVVSESYSSSTASSGVLTVTSGGSAEVVAGINFSGHYVTSSLHLTFGTGGTVEIFDPPIPNADQRAGVRLVLMSNLLA